MIGKGSNFYLGLISLFGLIVLGSCSSGSGTSVPLEPTLTSIQANIFNRSCAVTGCHNDATHKGEMRLTDGNAFSNLVNVAADIDSSKTRVIPGDPDGSLIIHKLEGPADDEGDRMPKDEDALPQSEIDVIRQWIADGALDN